MNYMSASGSLTSALKHMKTEKGIGTISSLLKERTARPNIWSSHVSVGEMSAEE